MKKLQIWSTVVLFAVTSTGAFAQQITGSSLFSPAAGGARILVTQGNTAANPAIGFHSTASTTSTAQNDGGGGNGIFRPLANTMAFATSSQERMRIDSNGRVGIGTANPTAALHLLTGSNPGMLPPTFIFERNDGTNQAGVLTTGLSSNGFASGLLGGGSAYFKLEDPFGNSPNSDMGFSTNGTAAQFVIKHNGFVGVGTETPSANFHSIGTARLESLPASATNSDIITTDANGNLATRSAASLFTSSGWNLNGNTTAATDFIGTLTANPFNIYTNNAQRAIITPTGEMGIGTTTPTAQLDVTSIPSNGQIAIKGKGKNIGVYGEAFEMTMAAVTQQGIDRGDVEAIGVFGKGTYTATSGNGSVFGVAGSAVTANNPLNNIGVLGEAKNALGYNTGVIGMNESTTGIYNTGTSGYVALNPSGIWSRAIAGYAPVAAHHFAGYFDGNVDIKSGVVTIGNGTLCTPTGYKLFVEQGILTEKVKVAVNCSTAWADYVFANDYKLKPLSEVEAYVNENKHLPNIPSASELVNDGLNLGEMQAKQMEKIEELTLYMIEMKKEIDTLKKENQSLKVLVAQPKN